MRRMRRLAILCGLLSLLSGCAAGNGLARIFARNVGAFFGTPAKAVPLRPPSYKAGQVAVTFIGHATTLVQIEDRFIVTDPVFTNNVGAVSRRIMGPGLQPDDLPWVSAVVISHQHFDHLSFGSLDLMRHHFQNLLVPEGTRALLPEQRFDVWEMPWGSRYRDGELLITSVPVKHVAGRYGIDAGWRPRGYQGYLFEYLGRVIFFAGDTALSPDYASVVRQLASGPIDIAILPIAPEKPRALMKRTHVDADEAMVLFELLGARHFVPVHFDTFINSDDTYGAAVARLEELARQKGIVDRVHVLAPGEQFVLDTRP
jgi:N-acyl-phosphatidylethanolamine-hydrolysing phospholipase D